MKTNWITFYSYKGGVGRSMALANVAALLASKGRRVVMIDFDLEAPGLDSFEEFTVKGAPGVVEYIADFLRTKITPSIETYVHRCKLNFESPGDLWLMPSGRKDTEYAERLHLMDWSFLYDSGLAEPFIANWKKAVERAFKPDYVLVDSRTGLTDVGGVCTLHFPDIVVLFFALNRQNLFGIAGVKQAISRVRDRDPIEIITVASPIPNLAREADSPLDNRLKEAQRVLGSNINAVVSYFPSIVLEEVLWTLKEGFPQPKIVEDYRAVAFQISLKLRDGFDFLLKRAREILVSQDEVAAEAVIQALQNEYDERAESYRTISSLERLRHDREASLRALEKALSIDPADRVTFEVLAGQYRALGRLAELRALVEGAHASLPREKSAKEKNMLFPIAERFMQIGEYRKALECYQDANESPVDPGPNLVLRFNVAEARRRLTREIHPLDWVRVVELLDSNLSNVVGENDAPQAEILANRMQALHVAFAVTGNSDRAQTCLEKALSAAATINDAASIFSLGEYANVPIREFIRTTQGMLDALKRGELWDGMKLPTVQPEKSLA